MPKMFVRGLIFLAAMTSLSAAAPVVLSQYRDVTLGDSVAAVLNELQLEAASVKVLYEQPSLVQEITWRPHRYVSGITVPPDPLGEMALTFHLGQLVRIVAVYDRERIRGLSDADLLELVGGVYGTSILPSTSTQVLVSEASARHVVGVWADEDTQLLLWSEKYPRRVGLTITATAHEPALQEAMAEGARLFAKGEPQRALDKDAAAAAAIKERDARIRLQNKATFKP